MYAHFYFRFSPREELIDYHLQFLRRLRQRQRQESIVLTIDIFRLQFSGLLCGQLRSLCGESTSIF
jgi:hypothetical protein